MTAWLWGYVKCFVIGRLSNEVTQVRNRDSNYFWCSVDGFIESATSCEEPDVASERSRGLWGGIRGPGHHREKDSEALFVNLTLIFSIMWHLFLQRLFLWTLAAAWFWTRARVGTTASAGTTTSRPTPAPSSGTEAATATRTASTQRRSARGRAWSADQQVHSWIIHINTVHVIHT